MTASDQAKKIGFQIRAGQREFEQGVRRFRVCGLLARRQYGKTTIASRIAMRVMMKNPGDSVIFGSVKVDLGREIVRKEADAIQKAFRLLCAQADAAKLLMQLADQETKALLPLTLSADEFAELYEATRLEFRLYHSKNLYSRTKVVALTPDAVGETGYLILDEVGRAKRFREVLEAMMPIISSNPYFRAMYTTTPPPDDTHPSFDLLAPPAEIAETLPISPTGNWYKSILGINVLRITDQDAYADGLPLYDDETGAPMSPDVARQKASDKDAYDRNYRCKFVAGGTGACNAQYLDTAQRRGLELGCRLFIISGEEDLKRALATIIPLLGPGKIGVGFDVATTTKKISNPSSVSLVEENGVEKIVRAIFVWKTADPDVAKGYLWQIIRAVQARKLGGAPRRLCVDATNERYFASDVKKEFSSVVPVELVVASETLDVPGEDTPITFKQHLGSLLVADLDDNRLLLPGERYLRDDWRSVKKEKGLFVCEPDSTNGAHGDTFDSTKLGKWALVSTGGALLTVTGIYLGGHPVSMARHQPRILPCV